MQNKVDGIIDCRLIARLSGPVIYAAGSNVLQERINKYQWLNIILTLIHSSFCLLP
jgi:hypothetical protein